MKSHHVLAISLSIAFVVALVVPHWAAAKGGSYSGGSRSFSSSRSYSSPRVTTSPKVAAPKPTVVNKTIVNKTTVVHEHNTTNTSSGGGGGFSNMLLGGTIGYLIGSHNSNPPAQQVAPQPPSAQGVEQQIPFQPVVREVAQDDSHPWLWFFVIMAFVSLFSFLIWRTARG